MKFKYLLFDADNTLFDFDAAEHEAFYRMCAQHALPCSAEGYQLYHQINDRLWKELELGLCTKEFLLIERFRRWLREQGLTGDCAAMQSHYAAFLGESTLLLPGALELCRALAPHHEMYILTNAVASVQRTRFANSEIAPYFKDVFISETIGAAKPDPRYYEYVFRAVPGLTRENALVIGDSLSSDILGANNAGLPCLWFDPRGQSAPSDLRIDYRCTSLVEVLALIQRINEV